MNLLITNTQEDQAYLLAHCLRSEADKIVIAMQGRHLLQRWSALAPWSRYVDKRYTISEPSEEWWAGHIAPENSSCEETYIQRIEEICHREAITVVFPSFDPDIYVLSKNKARLARQGIVVVGPDYEQLLVPMNKFRTIEVAREAGFPCPLTFTPSCLEDLDEIISKVSPPWVVKPRFTAHSMETRIVTQPGELKAVYAATHRKQPNPLVQEYVPSFARQNYYIVVDRNMNIVSLLSPRVIRSRHRGVGLAESACVSSTKASFLPELYELVRRLGYWGCMGVQTIIDSRDGIPKLMEINPRVGDRLWYRTELGVNEPLIYLRMALEQPLPEFDEFPEGVCIVDPIGDIRNVGDRIIEAAIDRVRRGFGLAGIIPGYRSSQPLRDILSSMRLTYFDGKKSAVSPYVRHIFSDPLPCMLQTARVLVGLVRRRQYFIR